MRTPNRIIEKSCTICHYLSVNLIFQILRSSPRDCVKLQNILINHWNLNQLSTVHEIKKISSLCTSRSRIYPRYAISETFAVLETCSKLPNGRPVPLIIILEEICFPEPTTISNGEFQQYFNKIRIIVLRSYSRCAFRPTMQESLYTAKRIDSFTSNSEHCADFVKKHYFY